MPQLTTALRRIGGVSVLLIALNSASWAADDTEAAEQFEQLLAQVEAFEAGADPILASQLGSREALSKLPDLSESADERRLAARRRFLSALKEIDSTALTDQDAVSFRVLQWLLQQRVLRGAFDEGRIPFTSIDGFHTTMLDLAFQTPMRNADDGRRWLARLRALPAYLAAGETNLRRGMATGWTQPQIVTDLVTRQVRTLAETPAGSHPLLEPLKRLQRSDGEDLVAEGRETLATEVLPAYQQLLEFLTDDYVSRSKLALRSVPDGDDYYQARVGYFTTLPIEPDEVHELGLTEVARIRAQMEAIVREVGFEGSFAEFQHFLRTDSQFYVTSAEQLLKENAWVAKRIDGRMPEFFATLPRLPYGVRPMDTALANGGLTGFYQEGNARLGVAGNYVVNTTALDGRPLYELTALTLHEGVPGHHHQTSIAQEAESLPDFRKRLYINAFGEGWALYAEYLGLEMGIYQTPYERFGQLSYEMWRACRLVVDTGIHWLGWSRARAKRCFSENSALTEANIDAEVTRYISYPAQALSYKMGELKIKALRREAEQALGSAFDVRLFHDAVLSNGTLPLALLEEEVREWIEGQQR